ncbi:MAG: hypothetical protein U0905_17235 [Pirellulales bacterium]
MADRMVEPLSNNQDFSVLKVLAIQGFGITVSYWESLEAIAHWRNDAEHQVAQETGNPAGMSTTSCGWQRSNVPTQNKPSPRPTPTSAVFSQNFVACRGRIARRVAFD